VLKAYCRAIGLTESQGAAILSIATALNAVGRIVSGYAADKAGTINVLFVFNFLTGVMCFAVWLNADTYGTLIAFAILWGLFSGGKRVLSCHFNYFNLHS
jgi:nitrate/nitrite transporter NarK